MRAGWLLLLVAGCRLDAADLVAAANVEVRVSAIPASARTVELAARDATGAERTRVASVHGADITLYVGELAAGRAFVRLTAVDGAGAVLACREESVLVGEAPAQVSVALGAAGEHDAACDDGADNDCDGLADCADDDCKNVRRACAVGGCAGEQRCQSPDWNACASASATPEKGEAACHDNEDNDCDGAYDCDDSDCQCAGCGCPAP